jgi:DNA helicase-2/ATP-dependent DNA helicase PcrA
VAELVRLGREYLDLDPEGSSTTFESWLASSLRADDAAGGGDAVDLATFHAAKGLEWPIVHIAGLEEGFVPIHHATSSEARAEERRLLYVALTRAEHVLWCSGAERRTFGTKSVRRRPSPYLESIHLALELLSDRHDPVDLGRAVARQRSSMRAADGASRKDRGRRSGAAPVAEADRELFDSLKTWRRNHAKAADVPAFVIFNDATLQAVAASRPTSHVALLSVPGIGPVKAQRFGPDLLRIVAESS